MKYVAVYRIGVIRSGNCMYDVPPRNLVAFGTSHYLQRNDANATCRIYLALIWLLLYDGKLAIFHQILRSKLYAVSQAFLVLLKSFSNIKWNQ